MQQAKVELVHECRSVSRGQWLQRRQIEPSTLWPVRVDRHLVIHDQFDEINSSERARRVQKLKFRRLQTRSGQNVIRRIVIEYTIRKEQVLPHSERHSLP